MKIYNKQQNFTKNNHCIDCNKVISNNAIRCLSCNTIKEFQDNPDRKLIAIQNLPKDTSGENNGMFGRIGILHPNYIDGRSYQTYSWEFSYILKPLILKRDNYICQMCFQYHRFLEIHHKDCNKQNDNLENLITLGKECHQELHNIIREYLKYEYTR